MALLHPMKLSVYMVPEAKFVVDLFKSCMVDESKTGHLPKQCGSSQMRLEKPCRITDREGQGRWDSPQLSGDFRASQHPRSAVSSGASVNYYSMAPAYEHKLTRPGDVWNFIPSLDLPGNFNHSLVYPNDTAPQSHPWKINL